MIKAPGWIEAVLGLINLLALFVIGALIGAVLLSEKWR